MKFLNAVIIAGFAVSLSACAPKEKAHEAFLQVDSPFIQFVNSFEQAAALQGSPMAITDLVVSFGSTPTMNETGVCEWSENETPRITLNERIWRGLDDDDRQEVMFHELGHCILRRIHHTTEILAYGGALRIPESVMYPYRIPGYVYVHNQTLYDTELFRLSMRNQF